MTEQCTKERFLDDVKDHEMIIELDSGVHRCIRFKKKGTITFSFRIITWPGHLAISGDMGDYIFARLHDMFEFFGTAKDDLAINYGYWSSKLQASDIRGGTVAGKGTQPHNHFNPEKSIEWLLGCMSNDLKNIDSLKYDLEGCESDNDFLRVCDNHYIEDAWEYLVYTPNFHIIWCMYAIRYAIMRYHGEEIE